jgi:hypothetical protein
LETLQLPGFSTLSTQLALELYDPDNRLESDPTLADKHQAFATHIFKLYGIDPDVPGSSETLLPALIFDGVESGLDSEKVLIGRAERVVDVKKLIVPNVRSLLKNADQHADDILRGIGIKKIPRQRRTVYASARIAQAAYDGKVRKTGERYYEHANRAAAMGLYILNQLETEGYKVRPKVKSAVVSSALLHDATEETIRSCKYYSPDRPRVYSPLLVRKIFQKTGNPYGREVANSLRLMTHHAKQDWAPDYEAYVRLGSTDFIFSLVKPLDMQDNLNNPKPTEGLDKAAKDKIRGKRALYKRLIGNIAVNAAQRTDDPDQRLWVPRYFQLLKSINPADVPDMVKDLNLYIYGDPVEPAFKSIKTSPPGEPVTELEFSAAA